MELSVPEPRGDRVATRQGDHLWWWMSSCKKYHFVKVRQMHTCWNHYQKSRQWLLLRIFTVFPRPLNADLAVGNCVLFFCDTIIPLSLGKVNMIDHFYEKIPKNTGIHKLVLWWLPIYRGIFGLGIAFFGYCSAPLSTGFFRGKIFYKFLFINYWQIGKKVL